jgi:hypothetical protein
MYVSFDHSDVAMLGVPIQGHESLEVAGAVFLVHDSFPDSATFWLDSVCPH